MLKNDDENLKFSAEIAEKIENQSEISKPNLDEKIANESTKDDAKADLKATPNFDKQIEILSQKNIDDETKMAILKFKNRHFVLFLGEKNMLFTQNESQNIEDIKKILQEN